MLACNAGLHEACPPQRTRHAAACCAPSTNAPHPQTRKTQDRGGIRGRATSTINAAHNCLCGGSPGLLLATASPSIAKVHLPHAALRGAWALAPAAAQGALVRGRCGLRSRCWHVRGHERAVGCSVGSQWSDSAQPAAVAGAASVSQGQHSWRGEGSSSPRQRPNRTCNAPAELAGTEANRRCRACCWPPFFHAYVLRAAAAARSTQLSLAMHAAT
jgi:hypothetical protein